MTTEQRKPAARRAEAVRQAIENRLNAVDPTCRADVARRLGQMPEMYRVGYLRAITGEASPREAIKAQCLECVGWDGNEVSHCTAVACPLYGYRPYRDAKPLPQDTVCRIGQEVRQS